MKKVVKTLFQHDTLVSVRDYEVEECVRKNDAMHIHFEDEVMTLDPYSLENKKVLTSGPFPSKNGSKGYMLFSYKWNPNTNYND